MKKQKAADIKAICHADLDSPEYAYLFDCLQQAVAYCKEQFDSSNAEIDVLPSVKTISSSLQEADKFELLTTFVSLFKM